MRSRAAVAALLLASRERGAAAETPSFARSGSFVVGSETSALAASSVPRNEPYYALREERRNAAIVRANVEAFPLDRWSVGGNVLLAHERTSTLGAITGVGLGVRLGYVWPSSGRVAFWPGLSLSGRWDTTSSHTTTLGGDLRLVVSLTDAILLSIGPRLDLEVARPARERSVVLAIGLYAATRLDRPPPRRPTFGLRGIRVVTADTGISTTTRASEGGGLALASTRVAFGLDGFVSSGVSVGTTLGASSVGSGAGRLDAWVVGVRTGQAITFSDRTWWWPRFGVELSRAHVAGGASPTAVAAIVLSGPWIATIAPGVAFGVGPVLNIPIVGSGPRAKFSFGVDGSLTFYF